MHDKSNTIRVNGIFTSVQLHEILEAHQTYIDIIEFIGDGKALISTDSDVVLLWREDELGNWHLHRRFTEGLLSFFTDTTIIHILDDGHVDLLTLDGNIVQSFSTPIFGRRGALSLDHQWLITAQEGQLYLWDTRSFHLHAQISLFGSEDKRSESSTLKIYNATITPDGSLFIMCQTKHGELHRFEFDATYTHIVSRKSFPDYLETFDVFPEKNLLALIDEDEGVVLRDSQNFAFLHRYEADEYFFPVVFDPHGQSVAAVTDNGKAVIWDVETRQEDVSFEAHPDLSVESINAVDVMAWSPRGDLIATTGASTFKGHPGKIDCAIKLWKVERKQER